MSERRIVPKKLTLVNKIKHRIHFMFLLQCFQNNFTIKSKHYTRNNRNWPPDSVILFISITVVAECAADGD